MGSEAKNRRTPQFASDKMETGDELSMRDVIDGASSEDLVRVLISLEGRLLDVVSVQTALNAVRLGKSSATTKLPSRLTTATSLGALYIPAKRPRHDGTTASGTNTHNKSTTKNRNPAESEPACGGSSANSGNINTLDSRGQQLPACRTDMEHDETIGNTKQESGGVSSVVPTEMAKYADILSAGKPASGKSGGETGAARGGAEAASKPVVPSARGASWKEKQRLKQEGIGKKKRRAAARGDRDFDHSKWRRRTVAVQLMYEGEKFAGFCSQSEGNEDTIEKRLFHALTTTKLVDKIATGENYSRCGRTDRGVSALGNVVTVSARSKFPKDLNLELPTAPLGTLWLEESNKLCGKSSDRDENEDSSTSVGNRRRIADAEESLPVENSGVTDGPGRDAKQYGDSQSNGGKAAEVVRDNQAVVGSREAGSGNSKERGCASSEREVALISEGERDSIVDNQQFGITAGRQGAAVSDHQKIIRSDNDKETNGSRDAGTDPNSKKNTKSSSKGGALVREMDYCTMLNRVLPPEIRALAWAPVTDDFSARFSCSDRTYRYFFLARDLDIKAMDEAASRIVGTHDFRNLCKIDVANVSNFERLVKHASVKAVPSPSPDYGGSEYFRVCVFEVCGQAFLWHMVRCLMSVLFMVGRGLESPEIMSYLLNLDRCPAKPHYDMAPDGPLLLHACRFRSLKFQYTPENLYCLQAHLENLWEDAAIKAARLLNNLEYLAGMTIKQKDLEDYTAEKRAMKGSNTEHYSVRDHGKEGRERQERQQQEIEGTGAANDALSAENLQRSADLTWREGLEHMRRMGLGPGQVLGRKGHMPMVKRQKGLHYHELVDGLGGKKRERLDRHLAMKTAGQQSGATDAFYIAMHQQGVVRDEIPSKANAAKAPESAR